MTSIRNPVAVAALSLAVVTAACSDNPVAPAPFPTAVATAGLVPFPTAARTYERLAADRRLLGHRQAQLTRRKSRGRWTVLSRGAFPLEGDTRQQWRKR